MPRLCKCFPRAIYHGVGWLSSGQAAMQKPDSDRLWDGCTAAGPFGVVDDTRLYCTLYSRMHPNFSEDSSFRRGCLIAACMRRTAAHGRAGVSTSMLSSDRLTRLHHLCTVHRRSATAAPRHSRHQGCATLLVSMLWRTAFHLRDCKRHHFLRSVPAFWEVYTELSLLKMTLSDAIVQLKAAAKLKRSSLQHLCRFE